MGGALKPHNVRRIMQRHENGPSRRALDAAETRAARVARLDRACQRGDSILARLKEAK